MIKKLVLVATLIGAATAAQAVEIGVKGGTNLPSNENVWGVTVGQQMGRVNVSGEFTRSAAVDSYSIVGGVSVAKIGPATVAAKAGGVYVGGNSKGLADGYGVTVGAGASVPLAKSLAATVDYTYQRGQDRIESLNGSRVAAGLKYSF